MSRNFLAQRSAISSMGSTAAVSQMTTSITVGSQVESRVPATNMSFPERNVTIIDPSTIRFPGRNQLYLSKFSLTRKGELNGSGTALAVKAFLKVSPSLPPSSSVAEIAAAAISGPSIAANVGITQDTIPAEGIGSTNGPLPTLEETSGGNNNSNHSPIIMRKTLHGSIEMNNSSERIEMTGIATQHPPLTTPSLQQTNIPTSNNITSSKLGSSSGVMVNRLRSQSQIESRTNNHKRNTSNSATMNSIILGGGAGTALGSGGAANVKTRSALNIGGSIDHPEYTEQLSQLFKRQATEMSSANHKRLVAMFGIIPQQFSVIMEYFPMGSLEDFISSKQKSWRRRDQYCCAGDIAEGMDYLHSVLPESDKDLIVHMSLRSSNVLIYLDRGYARAKISDFGFAGKVIFI